MIVLGMLIGDPVKLFVYCYRYYCSNLRVDLEVNRHFFSSESKSVEDFNFQIKLGRRQADSHLINYHSIPKQTFVFVSKSITLYLN